MGRDPVTGRFLPGNKVAVGNRGNTNPKWGNTNAVKHGLFRRAMIIPRYLDDGSLVLYKIGLDPVRISPEGFIEDESGLFWFRDDVGEELEERGYKLKIGNGPELEVAEN